MTREYEEQGHVFVKEYPDLRVRQYLPNGLAWDRHTYEGYYVFEDENGLLHDRDFVGYTVVLFRPSEGDAWMRPWNIIQQISLSQGNDKEGNQIWMKGEFRPPGQTNQWVLLATGKHKGKKAEGPWHWLWPEDRDWEQPPKPEGYEYPNAEEFFYEFDEKDAKSEYVSPHYWIETAPMGLGDSKTIPRPAEKAPEKTRKVVEKGYVLVNKLPNLKLGKDVPGGLAFDQYTFEGLYKSHNPDSPFNDRPMIGIVMSLYKPEKPGEGMTADNLLCQYSSIQTGKQDEDQIWFWSEYHKPSKPNIVLKIATGEFEGLQGEGTFHLEWPEDWTEPEIPEGYQYAVAHEFTLEIPDTI